MASPHRGIVPLQFLSLVEPLVDGGDRAVRRHDAQDLGGGQGIRRVHMAPPEDRLDPPLHGEASVVPQHGSELRVDPSFDAVVG